MVLKTKLLLFILYFLSIAFNAQNTSISGSIDDKKSFDTLSYLKAFEIDKSKFIGKPFSYLLSKMNKIEPKTVWIVPNPIDTTMVEKSIFRFYDMNYPIMDEAKMLILWEKGMDYKTVSFNNKRNKFYFSDSEKRFFGSRIVKNILVYR